MTNQMQPCSDNEACVFALSGVEVVLGGKTILTEVNLDIPPGSRTAIVGRSGSGKSTMLRLLAFLLRPSSGSVSFLGNQPQPSDITSVRRSVPMVHQEPLLWGDTVRENMLRAFSYHSASDLKPPADESLAALLRATGLDEKMLTSGVAKLSGGEKQRVAIARALALEPDALLLDEPTSALDLLTAEQLFESLVESFPKLTVVLVTHSPSLVERCNNQVLLENGRVRATRSGLRADQLRNFLETGQ